MMSIRSVFGMDKDDRQFELLDRRVIDVQGKLVRLLDKIITLERKVDKRMSELSDAVAAIGNDVTELQAASKRVLDLLTQPTPDVQSAVAALQNADAGFDAIRDALNAAGGSAEPPASTE